jgi:tRNA (adenine22-N1)-methyltransferase
LWKFFGKKEEIVMQQLSKRLMAVSALVSQGDTAVDIGTDHAYVPIYLIQSGRIKSAFAMDINEGPLERAKEHICMSGLNDVIHIRLSDGLHGLKAEEAKDAVLIIAGMGGSLIIRILKEGEALLSSFCEMILQPQSDVAHVRTYLREAGFVIEAEDMVHDEGKYYPMMRVVKAKDGEIHEKDNLTQKMEDEFGPCLLKSRHPALLSFLRRQEYECEAIQEHLASVTDEKNMECRRQRIREVKRRQELIDRAIVTCDPSLAETNKGESHDL